jgi:hypothetical protein
MNSHARSNLPPGRNCAGRPHATHRPHARRRAANRCRRRSRNAHADHRARYQTLNTTTQTATSTTENAAASRADRPIWCVCVITISVTHTHHIGWDAGGLAGCDLRPAKLCLCGVGLGGGGGKAGAVTAAGRTGVTFDDSAQGGWRGDCPPTPPRPRSRGTLLLQPRQVRSWF